MKWSKFNPWSIVCPTMTDLMKTICQVSQTVIFNVFHNELHVIRALFNQINMHSLNNKYLTIFFFLQQCDIRKAKYLVLLIFRKNCAY